MELTAEYAGTAAGCKEHEVYLASTGVIGEPLDAKKFAHLLKGLVSSAEPDRFQDAARAIMTTDTYPKLATRTAMIGKNGMKLRSFTSKPNLFMLKVKDAPLTAPRSTLLRTIFEVLGG